MIVASNHQSPWDMIALIIHVPNPTFIVKKELFWIPVFGWWVKAIGSIGIDRSKGKSAMESIMEIAPDVLARGQQIVIFPEGTRTPVNVQKKYAAGIGRIYEACGIPCVALSHNSGYFWSRKGFDLSPGTITANFLEPIPAGLKQEDFMHRLETSIRHNMVIPDPDLAVETLTSP